ncbi:MAG: penicillin-binding protein 2 [candidate division WS1 bacterium]|nr:penicillin-binding protein 2 [candidate division WS1 bacterium]
MDSPTSNRRILVLGVAFGLVLMSYIVRLWTLQVANWTPYTLQASANRTSVVYGPAPRGLILDCAGRVLVDNQYVWNVEVVPNQLPTREDQLEQISAILAGILKDVSASRLRDTLQKLRSAQIQTVPLPGAQNVPFEIVAHIEERGRDLPGIRITEQAKRNYPHGTLAAHLLGYARGITKERLESYQYLDYPDSALGDTLATSGLKGIRSLPLYGSDSVVGQTGVERLLELDTHTAPPVPILQGRRSRTVYEVDARNVPLRMIHDESSAPGATVYLTLDLQIQSIAEQALEEAIKGSTGKTGAVVCLDLQTGGIIAMASYPTFDPNGWVRGWSPEEFEVLNNDPRRPLFDKAIGGQYPPASTFKIVSAAAALETTSITDTVTHVCKGIIYEGAQHQPYRCWLPQGHGTVEFYRGIAQSCDVYFYELVRKNGLTSTAIGEYARQFGFGEKPSIDLAGTVAGLVPNREYKRNRTGEPWHTGDSLNMVIGQGWLLATPLQVAIATGALATGGEIIEPTVVRKIAWPSHMRREPTLFERKVVRHLDVKPETLQKVAQGLRHAVTFENGTARMFNALPFDVAAKTGSAQHIPGKTAHAWMTAYAPFEQPRFVVTVLVTEGGYGSTTAGPPAYKILQAAMAAQQRLTPTE